MKNSVIKKFYSDPGHGWLAVKKQELLDLGIADKVSQFSYEKGKTVYLEEDCDAGLYVKAVEAKGIQIEFKGKNTDNRSPIRSYPSYML